MTDRQDSSAGFPAIRDATELSQLPEAERAACQALWSDVADLLLDVAFPTDPFVNGP